MDGPKKVNVAAIAIVYLFTVPVFSQNIIINEFMASNSTVIPDEDGDFSDWIELYNTGTETVNLAGWGLSDDLMQPYRWVFPQVTVEPGNYLLVWASGKDRRPSENERVPGIIREVYTGISGTSVSDLTEHSSYPDNPSNRYLVTDFFEAPVNFGDNYGQRMHGLICPPATGAYVFWISGDDNSELFLSTDESPSNGVTIASVPGWTSSRQWTKYTSQESASIQLQAGCDYYIRALQKEGSGGDNLAVRWRLPDGTMEEPIPAGRLTAGIQELHTNFAIKSEGEPLVLTQPDGSLADSVPAALLYEDLSYGRVTDGAAEWVFYKNGTPRASNALLTGYSDVLAPPVFSTSGGFYSEEFNLTLSNAEPNAAIYFTLDGSEPTTASAIYTGPLWIRVRHSDQNLVANIETTPAFNPAQVDTDFIAQQLLPAITWMPPGLVEKATVVRAMAAKSGALSSSIETQTYWVDPGIQTRFTLPVVSLSTDADNFFDPDYGIYVRGSSYVNSYPGRPWHSSPANYRNEGEAWERPVHVAFYGTDGQLWLEQDAGARIHGGATTALQQKTLRLYARGDYGDGSFSYPIFEDQPQTSYKRLLLRNSGNDWNLTLFRDALSQGVSRHMLADNMAYRPAVVFLNGEYWGIHNFRQRYDKYYLEQTYGVDPENLDLWNKGSMQEGDSTHYNSTKSYIENNNMADAENFAEAQRRIDTDEFIDYFIAEIYARNTDWPNNNMACWRVRTAYNPDMPYGHDGRWRWMLFDVEHGFGYSSATGQDYTYNMMSQARQYSIFNRLLYNTGFRNQFINRFADQLNTAYLPSRVLSLIDQMKARIAPEIPNHIERWQRPVSLADWDGQVQRMQTFATYRADAVREHLRSHFGLGSDQVLTLDVSDTLHGYIRVNRTDINEDTPGVSAAAPYPWTGKYYSGVPITLTAVPKQGYWFSCWQDAGGQTYSTQPVISVTVNQPTTLKALFVPAPQSYLMHYWSFNASPLMEPTYTLGGADMSIQPGAETVVESDTNEGFTGENCRLEETVGTHLRVNDPLGAAVIIALPTTGYETNVLRYETRRSGSGPGWQIISYSTDGTTFTTLQTINIADADPVLRTFDLNGLSGVDNNPNFKIRIQFAQGAGGTAGNNRFDNLTLDGVPLAGTNTPPQVTGPIGLQETVEDSPIDINLSYFFTDDGPLNYDVVVDKPTITGASLAGSTLTMTPLHRGEATIQVTASDGVNPPAASSFRVLVYPKAQPLRLGPVRFDFWSADEPQDAYPEHFLFLQSNVSDPSIGQALEYAYFIPHDDYDPDDQATIGYPYNNTSRTRINGLWDNGISFINTGRDRDLGGVLTALDTTGLESAQISWLAGTILTNDRQYAIRLQYRIGHTGPFNDVLAGGVPVEYLVQYDWHTQSFGPLGLPAELMNKDYVQLLWRYYHVGGTSGPRAQLRVDDIAVSGWLDMFGQIDLFAQWWLTTGCVTPDYCGQADLTRDGQVDLEDFAAISASWLVSTD
jgi:hypothetical protein